MGFILRKFVLFLALAMIVNSPAMAKEPSKTKSKAKSSLFSKKSSTKKTSTKKTSKKASSKRATPEGKAQYKSTVVNINKASASALSAYLVGIGPVKAKAIVDYRRKNGKFTSTKDLMNVEGVGEATFDGLKKNVSTSRGKAVAPEGYKMGEVSSKSSSSRKSTTKKKPASKRTKSSSTTSKRGSTSKSKLSTSKKSPSKAKKESSSTTKKKATTKKPTRAKKEPKTKKKTKKKPTSSKTKKKKTTKKKTTKKK